MSFIELDSVTRRFGDVAALDGVTFGLEEGRIHGLLGRNGAGKTTLMQVVTAHRRPSSGTVRVRGEDPWENAGVLRDVCFIREGQRYPDAFRASHALAAARVVYDRWDQDLADALVADFALPVRRRIKKLSRGQFSALGVIIGLASRAPITFFDEPYLGLDAVARHLFYDRLISDFGAHPRTIVLSTHLIDEIGDLLEHVVVLDRGRVLLDADAEALRGSAVMISGPAAAVDAACAGREVLHRTSLGSSARAVVRATAMEVTDAGLHIEPISLQELIVRLTQQAHTAHPAGASEGVLSS